MKVQVVDFLPALSPGITQEPEPSLWIWVAPLLQGQAWRQGDDAPKQRRMLGPDLRQRGNMNFWDDQKMHRRPGVNVVEGEYVLVLMNFLQGIRPATILQNRQLGSCVMVLQSKWGFSAWRGLRRRTFGAPCAGLFLPARWYRLAAPTQPAPAPG